MEHLHSHDIFIGHVCNAQICGIEVERLVLILLEDIISDYSSSAIHFLFGTSATSVTAPHRRLAVSTLYSSLVLVDLHIDLLVSHLRRSHSDEKLLSHIGWHLEPKLLDN